MKRALTWTFVIAVSLNKVASIERLVVEAVAACPLVVKAVVEVWHANLTVEGIIVAAFAGASQIFLIQILVQIFVFS